LFGVVLLTCAGITACGSSDDGRTLNLYAAPEQNFGKVVDECNAVSGGRYTIVYNKLPRDADGQREQMVRRLAAEDDTVDILGLDVTWTAEFAEAGWIREWTDANRQAATAGVLPAALATATWQDKLYAATKNTNVQLLWYRDDLVTEVPRTWRRMTEIAQELKYAGRPYQVILTGAQYEGLVVHYNTLVNSAGGHILTTDGLGVAMDDGAVRALGVLRDFANAGVTRPSFTNAKEDDARLEFQSGGGAFEINWPFVHPAMRKADPGLAEHFRWARYPGIDETTPSRVTIGGANLAVSSYSRRPDAAFEAALCLRNAEHQKFSAVNDGVPPTIDAVYDAPEMADAYPMKDTIRAELLDASVRPVTPAYQNVSTVLSTVLSPPSAIDPGLSADRLRRELRAALESRGVLP
jgi:multiple sugar transport system substrate-binding protein